MFKYCVILTLLILGGLISPWFAFIAPFLINEMLNVLNDVLPFLSQRKFEARVYET